MARLDRLAPVKEVAQIAAVIGREFSHELLAAVSPLSEAELGAALDQLVASELIFRRGTPPDATYSFKHALVQDAAYQSLLKSQAASSCTLGSRQPRGAIPRGEPDPSPKCSRTTSPRRVSTRRRQTAGTRLVSRPHSAPPTARLSSIFTRHSKS